MSLGWQAEVRRAISNWRYWCANWIFASVSAKSTKLHAPKSHFGLEDHNTTGVGGKFLARSRFRMRHSSLALLSLKLERNANYLVVEWILIPLQQQIECILSQDPKRQHDWKWYTRARANTKETANFRFLWAPQTLRAPREIYYI